MKNSLEGFLTALSDQTLKKIVFYSVSPNQKTIFKQQVDLGRHIDANDEDYFPLNYEKDEQFNDDEDNDYLFTLHYKILSDSSSNFHNDVKFQFYKDGSSSYHLEFDELSNNIIMDFEFFENLSNWSESAKTINELHEFFQEWKEKIIELCKN